MASPLVVERVVRAILRSFVHAGLVPSYADVAKIEAIPANYTDTQIDAVLNTITFSGAATAAADVVRSIEDVNIFIDSDNDDGYPVVRHFRVGQNQPDPPVTIQSHELLTVGYDLLGSGLIGTRTIFGPNSTIASGDNSTELKMASNTGAYYHGVIASGPQAVNGTAGTIVTGHDNLSLSGPAVEVRDVTAMSVRGGFSATASTSRFHVGDYTLLDSLVVETESSGSFSHYNIRTDNVTGTSKPIYVRGSSAATGYRVQMLVGGKYNEAWSALSSLGEATLSVVGETFTDPALASNVLYVYDRRTDRAAGTEIATIKGATIAGNLYYLFRCYAQATPVFRVRSDGSISVSGAGPLGTGAGDVAELVPTDATYTPGTVLVAQGGTITAATSYAHPGVVGVVSTRPGVELGQEAIYDTTDKVLIQPISFDRDTRSVRVVGQIIYAGTHVLVGEHYFVEVLYTEYDAAKDETHLILAEAISIDPTDETKLYCGIIQAPHCAKLAVAGIVPVRCSSEFGPIRGDGEWLVTGPGGVAVVSDEPIPGSTIGKALSALTSEVGTVRMLVCLR